MLHARPVEGRFRRLRRGADAILIAVLIAIPWIRIGGEPLVLLDIPARRFHVFGLVIFPQELYFLWLLLALLALSLFFFTALAGRLWCGWACPQTVFTDLFAGIARKIQGWRGFQPPRRVATWRIVATHAVWALVSLIVGFHLVAYFHSPYAVTDEIASGRIPVVASGFALVVSALAYLDFSFVKQTFCKFLCPYARFQGVLFDSDTLVVGYDPERGDPRGKKGSAAGDCVDCGLCVQVCPTDIDIRDGLQLECIACTQCIDACDGVMERTGRPSGLIAYRSLVSLEGLRATRFLRPRVLIYAGLIAIVSVSFASALGSRKVMDLEVIHNRAALYTTTADGRTSNAFTLRIHNFGRDARSFRIEVDPAQDFELIAGVNPIAVDPVAAVEARVFVISNESEAERVADPEFSFVLEPLDGSAPIVRSVHFIHGEKS